MTIELNASPQYVAGIFISNGKNEIEDNQFEEIKKDYYGQILIRNGILKVLDNSRRLKGRKKWHKM